MRIFNIDSPFMRLLSDISDLIVLNLLWLLCCLPVITIGASTSAMYYVAFRFVQHKGGSIRQEFLRAFRQNFKSATILTIIAILFIAVEGTVFYLLYFLKIPGRSVLLGIQIVQVLLLSLSSVYWFPQVAKFENTTKQYIINSFILMLRNLLKTFLILLLNVLPFILLIIAPDAFVGIATGWLVIGGALISCANAKLMMRIFKPMIAEPKTVEQ